MARAQRTKGQNVTLEVTTSNGTNKDSIKSSINNKVVTDDWDERPFPDLLDCHAAATAAVAAAQANSYMPETSLNMSEQAQTSLNMSVQQSQQPQQPPPPPFQPQMV